MFYQMNKNIIILFNEMKDDGQRGFKMRAAVLYHVISRHCITFSTMEEDSKRGWCAVLPCITTLLSFRSIGAMLPPAEGGRGEFGDGIAGGSNPAAAFVPSDPFWFLQRKEEGDVRTELVASVDCLVDRKRVHFAVRLAAWQLCLSARRV